MLNIWYWKEKQVSKTCNYILCYIQVPYFSIDDAHLMYNAHPKIFRRSFWCIDNAHDAN
jgi:hypothetical protein